MPGHGEGLRAKNGPPLAGHRAEAVRDAVVAAIATLPEQLCWSLAWDQCAEMARLCKSLAPKRYADPRIEHGLPVYFCDPQSPWQCGTNENAHGLLRQYVPKGTDLGLHGPDELEAVALNGRPRKTLEWQTPAEALDAHLLAAQNAGVATTG